LRKNRGRIIIKGRGFTKRKGFYPSEKVHPHGAHSVELLEA
jgi:hypothetical protein